jgi:hypothetical protein
VQPPVDEEGPEHLGFAALAGVWTGRVWLADDFDELPDDLADALGVRDG